MNAMMWVRGFAADYDEWAGHAGDDWSFARLVEYFTRIENVANASESDEGRNGPLHVVPPALAAPADPRVPRRCRRMRTPRRAGESA